MLRLFFRRAFCPQIFYNFDDFQKPIKVQNYQPNKQSESDKLFNFVSNLQAAHKDKVRQKEQTHHEKTHDKRPKGDQSPQEFFSSCFSQRSGEVQKHIRYIVQEQHRETDPFKVESRRENEHNVGKEMMQKHIKTVVLVYAEQKYERYPAKGQLSLIIIPESGKLGDIADPTGKDVPADMGETPHC